MNKIIEELQKIESFNGDSPTYFVRDNMLFVSAEDGKCFADYYGEFRDGYPWIHPLLESFAKKWKGYWEWQNPGCLVLVI